MIDMKMNPSSRLTPILRNIAVFILSAGIGLIFAVALVALADIRGWCCANSETFFKGGLLGIFLLFALLAFHVLCRRWVFFRGPHSPEFGRLAHLSYIFSAFGALPPNRVFVSEAWIVTAGLTCAVLGTVLGAVALIDRLRGRLVPQFGLSIIGILVGALWTHGYLASSPSGYIDITYDGMSKSGVYWKLENRSTRAIYVQGTGDKIWPNIPITTCTTSFYSDPRSDPPYFVDGYTSIIKVPPGGQFRLNVDTDLPAEYKGGRCYVRVGFLGGTFAESHDFTPK